MPLYQNGQFVGVQNKTQRPGRLYDSTGNYMGPQTIKSQSKNQSLGIGGTKPNFNQAVNTAKGIFNFFTGAEQSLGKDIANIAGPQQFTPEQAAQNGQQVGKLITQAHQLPIGDPRRTKLIQIANQIATTGSNLSSQNIKNLPTKGQVGLDIAGSTADLLSVGTYGKSTALMKTGELMSKTPSLITAGSKVISSIEQKTAQKLEGKIIETVSPKLTAKETAEAISSRGAKKAGVFGKITANPDPFIKKVAKTIQDFVPDFDSKKTLVENISSVKTSLYKSADFLKRAVDNLASKKLYTFKELGSTLRNLSKPVLVSSDQTLNRAYDQVINKFLDIAQKRGGTISSLFDARKEFDSFIEQQFPNLYASETLTPMRTAIKQIRGAVNDFIANELPDGFKELLYRQSDMYTAIDNMSEKAAKEIGTTNVSRFLQKYPTIGKVIKYGAVTAGGAAGAEVFNKLNNP